MSCTGTSAELLVSEFEHPFRVLPGQVELASMDGDDRIGRWSCGISSPYWTEMSRARAAYSAASAQRPAQNSTQARPQSARELLGSSRSRHSSYSRSSKARASSLFGSGREGVHDRQSRLPHQQFATDSAREVAGARR